MKKLFSLMFLLLTAFVLVGCGGDEEPTGEKIMNPDVEPGTIVIWVGTESAEFYQGVADDYIEQFNADPTKPYLYPHQIEVRAVDGGTAAGVFLDDPASGPDILTVAHDNLGRLIAGSPAIYPITYEPLLAQIEAYNTVEIQSVIRANSGGESFIWGVPYEAQSLVLYYDNSKLTEEDVKTWEGIWAKAKEHDARSVTVTGLDGYNNSFLVLSSFVETGIMPVEIYRDGILTNTQLVNDGAISMMRWGQRFFSDPNGAGEASDSGWEVDLANGATLSIIGGFWNFNAASAALGENLSITVLPQYTLTEDDVYGDIEAGTVMQSGTFADAKMFVINKRSAYLFYLEDILLYMTTKEVQEASFLANSTLPAYKNAFTEFEGMDGTDVRTQLAVSQIAMFQHGIPQPFGVDARFNFYYYQKQGPEKLFDMLINRNGDYSTVEQIIAQMEVVEAIWRNNN